MRVLVVFTVCQAVASWALATGVLSLAWTVSLLAAESWLCVMAATVMAVIATRENQRVSVAVQAVRAQVREMRGDE